MARWQRAGAAGRTGRGAAGAGTTGEARLPKAPSALSDRAGRTASASTAIAFPRRSAALHAAECEGLSPAAHVAAPAPPPCADRGRRASQTPRTQDVIRTQLWRAAFSVRFSKIVNAFARFALRVLVCYRKCFRVSTTLFSEACPPNSSYLYLFTTWVQRAVRRFDFSEITLTHW